MPAASAVDDPDTPAKSMLTTTLIWPKPPGRWPTDARARVTNRSVIRAAFIKLADSTKNGTDSKINELYDFHISLIKTTGFRRLSMSRTGRHANPSANDTGIRTTISTAKTPNISSETSPGLMRMTPWQVGGAGEYQPRYFPRGKAPT